MMPRRYLLPTVLLAALSCAVALFPVRREVLAEQPPGVTFAKEGVAFLEKHCLSCHGEKVQRADLSLHTYREEATLLKGRSVFQKVLQMLASGEMPPPKRPRPTSEEIEGFVRAVDAVFDRADRNAKPDPGRVTI